MLIEIAMLCGGAAILISSVLGSTELEQYYHCKICEKYPDLWLYVFGIVAFSFIPLAVYCSIFGYV